MSREKSEKVCITFRLSREEHEKLKQYSSQAAVCPPQNLCVSYAGETHRSHSQRKNFGNY